MRPRKNVPVVRITDGAVNDTPMVVPTPTTRPSSTRI
jgi:hypothetical protein